jgi:hypothetical protein
VIVIITIKKFKKNIPRKILAKPAKNPQKLSKTHKKPTKTSKLENPSTAILVVTWLTEI